MHSVGLPWLSTSSDATLPWQGAQVHFLIEELRSCKPCAAQLEERNAWCYGCTITVSHEISTLKNTLCYLINTFSSLNSLQQCVHVYKFMRYSLQSCFHLADDRRIFRESKWLGQDISNLCCWCCNLCHLTLYVRLFLPYDSTSLFSARRGMTVHRDKKGRLKWW